MALLQVTGSCLCGRVVYEITGPFQGFRYCHCERCRKLTGSAHSSNVIVPKDQLRWTTGEKERTVFIYKEADHYARAFCRTCGGPVPKLTRDSTRYVVPAGTLDGDPEIRPSQNIYWSLHAPWLVPYNELPTHEKMPEKP